MDAEAPMNSRAINAKEDPKRNRRPSRVLRITIETDLNKTNPQISNPSAFFRFKNPKTKNKNQLTHLVLGLGLEPPENRVLVGEAIRRRHCNNAGDRNSEKNSPNPKSKIQNG